MSTNNDVNILRILLLGKTGVGKSSFINYFLGKEVAAAGVGEPCTQTFDKYTYDKLSDCTIELWDSKGLEVLDYDTWRENVMETVSETNSGDFADWYHIIFYCISAKKKIEEQELNFIKDLATVAKHGVHVILTNCDESEDKIVAHEQYIRQILGENTQVYRIVSVSMQKLSGTVEPSGREELLDDVFKLLWIDISGYIAKKVADYMHMGLVFAVSQSEKKTLAWVEENLKLNTRLSNGTIDEYDFDDIMFGSIDAETERLSEACKEALKDEIATLNRIYASYYSAYKADLELDINSIIFRIFIDVSQVGMKNRLDDYFTMTHMLTISENDSGWEYDDIEETDSLKDIGRKFKRMFGGMGKSVSGVLKLKKETETMVKAMARRAKNNFYDIDFERTVLKCLLEANPLCADALARVNYEIEKNDKLKEFISSFNNFLEGQYREKYEDKYKDYDCADSLIDCYTYRDLENEILRNYDKRKESIRMEKKYGEDIFSKEIFTPIGLQKLGYDPETHDAVCFPGSSMVGSWMPIEYVNGEWKFVGIDDEDDND